MKIDMKEVINKQVFVHMTYDHGTNKDDNINRSSTL